MCYIRGVAHRWLLFVHQLPAHPTNGRVKIWRRLQQIGAVPVKNGVHVLPDSPHTLEDFEWLAAEVAAVGGQASIFHVPSMNEADERHVIRKFQTASAEEYTQLRKDIKMITQTRQRTKANADDLHATRALVDRFERVSQRDFFGGSGATETERALGRLAAPYDSPTRRRTANKIPSAEAETYRNRTWVTRPRPGVDRFSSAWLIRRFIDRNATFVFAPSPEKYPDALPFDMYQSGGFKHKGDLCTFEVLEDHFDIRDAAVRRIAEIVHDIDLKEEKYKSVHVSTVASLVEGLRASIADDGKLLEQGMAMFEALYLSFRAGKGQRRRRVVYT
jgi:hypothetical protein